MSRQLPRRRLLSPPWLVMHLLVLVAAYAMLRLGLWQWHRGEGSGGLRNYSYGLEWWAFLVLTLVGWVKFCVDETVAEPRERVPRQRAGVPVAPLPAAQPVSADEDPELAAWNARFADLARRDGERSS